MILTISDTSSKWNPISASAHMVHVWFLEFPFKPVVTSCCFPQLWSNIKSSTCVLYWWRKQTASQCSRTSPEGQIFLRITIKAKPLFLQPHCDDFLYSWPLKGSPISQPSHLSFSSPPAKQPSTLPWTNSFSVKADTHPYWILTKRYSLLCAISYRVFLTRCQGIKP